MQDVRFTLRSLRRSPAFTATAVAVLAIGIGMAVAMFTIFRTLLVARLPVVDQDRVAVMWTYRIPTTDLACPAECLDQVRQRSTTMTDIAPAVNWGSVARAFDDAGHSLSLAYAPVGSNFFEVLGARALIGRLLVSGQDDAPVIPPGDAPATNPAPLNAVLSYRAWMRHFHGDSSVIGRRIVEVLFEQPYTIVGVLPPGLEYPSGGELWAPLPGGRASLYPSFAVARLKPGVTLAAASAEFLTLSNAVEPRLKAVGVHSATFTDTVVGNARPIIFVLTAAVALLLLITCLNVGNLLLLRASSRARELGLRRVLGATYADVVRQLLIEATLLGASGGVLGLGLALALLRATTLLAARSLPRVDELTVLGEPAILALVTTGVAVLLFGLVPSLVIARGSHGGTLRIDTHTGNETRRRQRLRQTLVGAQVALAMITLGGAGLLAKSLERLQRQDVGYDGEHLTILLMTWDVRHIFTAPGLTELGQRIERNLAAIPGISATTPLVVPPFYGNAVFQTQLQKEGQTAAEAQRNPMLNYEVIGPGFFKTFGTRVLRGRGFNADDRTTSPLVAIVSERFAQRYWPGENPIGKRVAMPNAQDRYFVGGNAMRTVVGIVEDTYLRTIREPTPLVYFPLSQGYWQGQFAIRTAESLTQLRPALERAVSDAGGGVRLYEVQPMDDLLAAPLAKPRLSALLMSTFGLVALLLSAIGLYGVMASLVRDQTRDIGIRMALGATSARVRNDVLSRAATTIAVGAGIGVVGAIASSRLLGDLLYQVKPSDPVALASAAAVLLCAGVVAAYIPARRATRIDPARALRAE